MDNKAFFQQISRNIQSLIVEGKINDAYLKCKDVLQKYPQEKTFKELENLIAEKLGEKNKVKIQEGIKEIKTLSKEGKIEEGLQKTKELLKVAPNDTKLTKLYLHLEEEYKEKFIKLEKEFLNKTEKELEDLLKKDEDTEYLKKIYGLENEYKKNKKIQQLVQLAKENLIKKELEKKRELIGSSKFEDIENMISNMKNIFDQSPTLQKLEKEIRQRKMGKTVETLNNFEYSGVHNINTLMKMGKYEEAERATAELVKANPNNKEAQILYKKAKAKKDKLIRNKAVAYIEKVLPSLEAEYKENKDNFVKL